MPKGPFFVIFYTISENSVGQVHHWTGRTFKNSRAANPSQTDPIPEKKSRWTNFTQTDKKPLKALADSSAKNAIFLMRSLMCNHRSYFRWVCNLMNISELWPPYTCRSSFWQYIKYSTFNTFSLLKVDKKYALCMHQIVTRFNLI